MVIKHNFRTYVNQIPSTIVEKWCTFKCSFFHFSLQFVKRLDLLPRSALSMIFTAITISGQHLRQISAPLKQCYMCQIHILVLKGLYFIAVYNNILMSTFILCILLTSNSSWHHRSLSCQYQTLTLSPEPEMQLLSQFCGLLATKRNKIIISFYDQTI